MMEKKNGKSVQKHKELDQDLLEEAQRIEEELDSMEDPWENDPEVEERLRRKIYRRILEEQQQMIKKRSLVQRIGKYAAMFMITLVAIFGVSMTSQANRQRFIQSITYMIGNEEATEISNTENLDDSDREEEAARVDIEEKLGCKYPAFMYRPSGFALKEYTILEGSQNAFVEYSCQGQTLILYITRSDEEFTNNLLHQGDVIDNFMVDNGEIEMEVTVRTDEGDEQAAYVTHWIYDNCYYDLSGKVAKEEFIKILENIRF